MSLLDPAPSGSEGLSRDAGDGAELTPEVRRDAHQALVPGNSLNKGARPGRRRNRLTLPRAPSWPGTCVKPGVGSGERRAGLGRVIEGSPWVGPVSCDAAKHYAGSRGRGGHDGYWSLRLPWARLETTPARPWVSLRMEATRRPGRRASCSRIASVCRGWRRLLGWMVSIDVRLPVDANMRRWK